MRLLLQLLLLICFFLPRECQADGGTLQLMQQQGSYQLSVFTSPSVLRVGLIDISVLLQQADSGKVINNADILLTLVHRETPSQKILVSATMAAATNKLLSAAVIEMPMPGWWDVSILCKVSAHEPLVMIQFPLNVAPALPGTLTFWPWFTWPLIPVVLFVIHRIIVARTERHKKSLAAARNRLPSHEKLKISATTD